MAEAAEPLEAPGQAEAGAPSANAGGGVNPEGYTLYVGNLHQASHEGELAALFAALTPPTNVKVMRDKATGARGRAGAAPTVSPDQAEGRPRARPSEQPGLTHSRAW